MKYAKWVLLLVAVGLLGGCGILKAAGDFLMGVTEEEVQIVEKVEITDPETGEKHIEERIIGTEKRPIRREGQAPIELILGALGLGAIGAASRWIYTEARVRKLGGAFKAVVTGLTNAVDNGVVGPKAKPFLYEAMTNASEIYSHRDFFVKAVARIKDEIRALKK